MKRATKASARGSDEAIEKRRVARALNAIFSDKKGRSLSDGRTAKRRLRLLKELKEGRNGRALTAIEVMSYADELLRLGEPLHAIRKNGVTLAKVDLPADVHQIAQRAQAAYDFHPDAWKLLGISIKESGKRTKPRARPRTARS